MSAETVYDRHAAFYLDFVDRGLAAADRHLQQQLDLIVQLLGARLPGAKVLDLCCGEGYLGRHLKAQGAAEVLGVDASVALIDAARARADAGELAYRVDDAQSLASVADASFEVAVSQMAMMDVADHRRLFAAVRRVVRPGGIFVFSMLHPCFKGRPFHLPETTEYVLDDDGSPTSVLVSRYATEGAWSSGGTGVRGRVGAQHRTVSTYVNDLIAAGFTLERLEEPVAVGQGPLFAEVPTVMMIAARAEGGGLRP